MERSKLEFSNQQLLLLREQTMWNARRELVSKLSEWMGEALIELKRSHQGIFESFVPSSSMNGKITRGESYNGFPYVLLDYPNHFSKDEIVAARNLIWFGNGFHCTLHLKGNLAANALRNLNKLEAVTTSKGVSRRSPLDLSDKPFVFVGQNEWVHHINNEEWIEVNAVTETQRQQVETQAWIKLGIEIPLIQPDSWTNALVDVYKTWFLVLSGD